jgi:hypothetical protein
MVAFILLTRTAELLWTKLSRWNGFMTIHRSSFFAAADPVLPEEEREVNGELSVTVSTPEADEPVSVNSNWGGSVRVLFERQ